jgi:hypothetical protein
MKKLTTILIIIMLFTFCSVAFAEEFPLKIETKKELVYGMNKVIDANSTTVSYEDKGFGFWIHWINVDHYLMSLYYKAMKRGNSHPNVEWFAKELYNTFIYINNGGGNMFRDYLVLNVKVFDEEKIDLNYNHVPDNSVYIKYKDKKIQARHAKRIRPVLAPNKKGYKSQNKNWDKIYDKYPYEYMLYFDKEVIGEIFVKGELDKLKLVVSPRIDDGDYLQEKETSIPLHNSPKPIKKLRNAVLKEMDSMAKNGEFWGVEWQNYVYKPGRKIILPKRIEFWD